MRAEQSQRLEFKNRVFWLVWNIPFGKCISYGDLATLAGNPRAARIVGGIAHNGPSDLPWHRVVYKDGKLASGFPGGPSNQKEMLQSESIEFTDDDIVSNNKIFWWTPPSSILKPIVVIIGETASGKSSIAMGLAKEFSGSIISADAWTVRRGLDIGTAKPSREDQAQVKHYLIDEVNVDESFSAAKFKDLAKDAIRDSYSSRSLPIIVGGNGLYVDGLIYGYSFLEKYDESLRKWLQSLDTKEVLNEASALGLDCSGVDTKNKRRLIRLIETQGHHPLRSPVRRPNTLLLGVRRTSEEMKARIKERIDQMIEVGLVDEVRNLVDKHGWDNEIMKAICYREFEGYFEGDKSLEEVKSLIVRSTNNLAKRQRTWNRKYEDIHWLSAIEEASRLVCKFLDQSGYNTK